MNEITRVQNAVIPDQYTAGDVMQQMALIQEVIGQAMKLNEHYGVIPGISGKPTLLKAGAEKLCLLFRLAASFEIQEKELKSSHREYVVITTLTHIPSGIIWGQGVGSCSTMESKYRFRNVKLDEQIPNDYKQNKAEYKKQGFSCKKIDGEWGWYQRQENDSIADVLNTILKMAKKRSLVDATLTCIAASDIFAQDLEELRDNGVLPEEKPVESQESFITGKVWIGLCKKAMAVKDPDGKPFSTEHLSNAIKKYFKCKVPSKITFEQYEIIENSWFFEFARGNWDEFKKSLEEK